MGSDVPRDDAVWELAERLYKTMERHDPTEGEPDWAALSDRQREFYRLCVEGIFEERALSRAALR